MRDACVIFGYNNTADPKRGIGPLKILFWGDTGAEFIKRRRIWLTENTFPFLISGFTALCLWVRGNVLLQ